MNIRSYSQSDRHVCLEILESNTPEFFIPTDCDGYATFLHNLPGPYFVLEQFGQIAACGGWALDTEGVADLTWGMVRRKCIDPCETSTRARVHAEWFSRSNFRSCPALRARGSVRHVWEQPAKSGGRLVSNIRLNRSDNLQLAQLPNDIGGTGRCDVQSIRQSFCPLDSRARTRACARKGFT
jgi:hypothetical protein